MAFEHLHIIEIISAPVVEQVIIRYVTESTLPNLYLLLPQKTIQ